MAYYRLRGMGCMEVFCLSARESQFVDVRDLIALAPLYQQIVDWFYNKHNIRIIYYTDKSKLNNAIKDAFRLI